MDNAPLGTVLRHIRRLVVAPANLELSDRQLLERFAAGRDEGAFAALVQRHAPLVWNVCRRVLRHEQDAEDAWQATFLILAGHAARVRRAEALPAWLHAVAFRVALAAKRDDARRRAQERRGKVMTQGSTGADLAWRELRGVLDEEVSRLPPKWRAPFVLCCLEGKSKPEAAQELGWKEGTVAGRLAQARQRLRERLARRGVTLTALLGLAVLADHPVAAAVPPRLIQAVIKAGPCVAAGQPAAAVASPPVAGLVQGGSRAMFVAKLQMAPLLLVAGLCALGAGLVTHRTLAAPPADPPRNSSPQVPAPLKGPAQDKGKAKAPVVVRGRVVNPEGQPVKDARLYFLFCASGRSKVRATTSADGRFRFPVGEADFQVFPDPNPWGRATILAFAPGYGPAWVEPGTAAAAGDVRLRLARDDFPIQGRLLDLQGQPVRGATVRLQTLLVPAKGDLGAWLTALQANRDNALAVEFRCLKHFDRGTFTDLFPAVTTGADGRFQIRGVGRERVAELRIEGPTIETRHVHVRTRAGAPIHAQAERHNPGGQPLTYYGAAFTHAAGPTLPVRGVVRARDSGKPLAGVRVASEIVAGNNVMGNDLVSATTDANGCYRLTGLPQRKGNRIKAVPADGQPYLLSVKAVPDPFKGDPARVDFALQRGVVVTGRVTDKVTGKPAPAGVSYFVFADNPYLKGSPGFTAESLFWTKADGRFRFVVFPGRGILACRAGSGGYPVGVGADQIKGADPQGFFRTYPYHCHPVNFNALAEVNPGKDAVAVTCDLVLDAGRTLTGTVLGPDGNPLPGAQVSGLRDRGGWEPSPLTTAEFQVRNLTAGKPRPLVFRHPGKRLAGYCQLRGDAQGPVRVKLQPWAVVTGRLLGADGRPRTRVDLIFWSSPSLPGNRIRPDKDGKFCLEGLAPGLKYTLAVVKNGNVLDGWVFQGLTVRAGETKDLGHVRSQRSAPGE
jgi:RNA polymerase sigma factor (sigma-70 family)